MAESNETPLLDLLGRMTLDSVETSSLEPDELMLVRIAALVAVDAPPVSYLTNAEAAADDGDRRGEGFAASLPRSRRSSEPPEWLPRPATSPRRSTSRSRSRSSTGKRQTKQQCC